MSMRIKKIAIILAIPLLLAVVALAAVPLLVDAEQVKTQLSTIALEQHGLKLSGGEGASVSAFPEPSINFPNISLTNEAGVEVAEIPALHIQIGWLGLFSQSVHTVSLVEPNIRIDQQQRDLFFKLSRQTSDNKSLSITITNGRIKLLGDTTGQNIYLKDGLVLSNVSANYSPGAQASSLALSFDWKKQRVATQFHYASESKEISGQISVGSILNSTFKGALSGSDALKWQGEMSHEIKDALTLSNWLASDANKEAGVAQTDNTTTYPLHFSSKAEVTSEYLMLHRSDAKFKDKDAQFALFAGWSNFISLAIELTPESLQADAFIHAFALDLLPSTKANQSFVSPLVTEPLPDYVNVMLMMDIDKVGMGNKTYTNLDITAELSKGDVYIHRATMKMPGTSTLELSGTLRQLPEGRRFSGKANMHGKQFNEWLANFEPLAVNLPKEDFSNFRFAGNLFVSKEQLRLSEADLKIGELEFRGGFATFFDQIPRVEADVKLNNINLDYFRDIWLKQEKQENTVLTDGGASFDWLRRLPAVLDFHIAIDGFTFLDTQGSTFNTRLYSKPGEMVLSGVDMRLTNNVINGNVKFNVMYEKPSLELVMTSSTFDTAYFLQGEEKERPPVLEKGEDGRQWSEELFDFDLFNHFDGTVDISIGTLRHEDETYENFKWLAELNSQTLDVKKLTFNLLGGTFGINGTLIGGSVPGISASYSLYDADLKEILSRVFDVETITGRVSLSGVIGTSGIHPKAWLEQGEMKVNAAARGVRVKNFNLQGLIDGAKAARSTMDIQDSAKERLFDGMTELSVDGNLNIDRGVMKTPGLRLGYGYAQGDLRGEINLKDWTLNLGSGWQFPELSSSTIPTLNISMQGSIDEYETRVDTASLEAFVAKHIVGQ